MTEEQLEAYRGELNTPYSDEELGIHLTDRDAKSLLEITHADNFRLIRLARKWMAYLGGKGPRPERNIWRYLIPGYNKENSACDRMNQLAEYYAQFAYGQAPVFRTAFLCSRSTVTLIRELEELHYTPHLDTAERAAKDFFTIITNESPTDYTRARLKAMLQKCVNDFTTACEANAKELHAHLLDFIRGNRKRQPATKDEVEKIVKREAASVKTKQDVALTTLTDVKKTVVRIDNREKKAQRLKRKSQYSLDQLNAIHTLWLSAQKNPSVKSLSAHKPNYDAALNYYKKEFDALDVRDRDNLKKALKAWCKRVTKDSSGRKRV